MSVPFTWNATGGTIDASGVFSATTTGVGFVVTASSGTRSGSAVVDVVAPAPGATLSPTRDAFVRDGIHASNTYGTLATLEVKTDTVDWTRQTFIVFDGSGVTGAIARARLRLYGATAQPSPMTIEVLAVSITDWSEPAVTWNTRPALGTTVVGSTVIDGTSARWHEIDVTSYVASEATAGRRVVGFVLRNPGMSANVASFASREATANRPQLVLGD
jgi:hyaluronate lyase